MDSVIKSIMNEVRFEVSTILAGVKFGADEALLNVHRGKINGLLKAAEIITGDEWDWEPDGIYRNHGNEPYIKW